MRFKPRVIPFSEPIAKAFALGFRPCYKIRVYIHSDYEGKAAYHDEHRQGKVSKSDAACRLRCPSPCSRCLPAPLPVFCRPWGGQQFHSSMSPLHHFQLHNPEPVVFGSGCISVNRSLAAFLGTDLQRNSFRSGVGSRTGSSLNRAEPIVLDPNRYCLERLQFEGASCTVLFAGAGRYLCISL